MKSDTCYSMSIRDSYVIGNAYHALWSPGFNREAYLKVLPHPDQEVAFNSPWLEWRRDQRNYKKGIYKSSGRNGSYYSSWGPDKVLDVTLKLEERDQIQIDGLGVLKANPVANDSIYDDNFNLYNGRSSGPLLVADPGDTLRIKIVNKLKTVAEYPYNALTNLHTHGLHVSPLGYGDNVMISIAPGQTWETEIKIPDDHYIGPDWYHPHLHGGTNVQISKGLAGTLLIQPSLEEAPDLDKFSPVEDPIYWFALQTWALNQEERPASDTDPLNQDQGGGSYRIGTPIASTTDGNGQPVYTLSAAPYLGYNYYPGPFSYNPLYPTPQAQGYQQASAAAQAAGGALFTYGAGTNGAPIENIIHTVNGQYNPTLGLNVGEWTIFGFLNESVNSHHVIQLVREENSQYTLEEFQVVAIDGDAVGAASDALQYVTETPVLAPGGRVTIQHVFTKPGSYYFLSNATEELLGDLAPEVANTDSFTPFGPSTYAGINDGHLVWGSQVLSTVEVTGEAIENKPPQPQPLNMLVQQGREIDTWIEESKASLADGDLRTRSFIWNANFGNLAGQPDDNDPASFQGVYTINGRDFGHSPESQTVLAMPMLGTTEEWSLFNTSISIGIPSTWGEWHPFHIHQNDFTVTEINGIPVEELDYYPVNQMADTVVLAGMYIAGTQTPENPYGQAAWLNVGQNGALIPVEGATPFNTKILMKFEDYTGTFVNHCHILFHEDAGMMQAVRVILNTDSSFVTKETSANPVELSLGSDPDNTFRLDAYRQSQIEVNSASADINFIGDRSNHEASDNVADVAVVQRFTAPRQPLKIKIYDGEGIKNRAGLGGGQPASSLDFATANNTEVLQNVITPFGGRNFRNAQTALAVGDVNGDGFSDVIIGIGGANLRPRVQIFSGKDSSLLANLSPFQNASAATTINLASGDINSDNFADIIIGQGNGGEGLVEAFDGLSLSELVKADSRMNPQLMRFKNARARTTRNGRYVAAQSAMFTDRFQPYGPDYTGSVDVASGYILPRPEAHIPDQVVQTSFANLTTLAVDQDSSEQNPSIKSFYVSVAEAAHGNSAHVHESDVPMFVAAINPDEKLISITDTFFDLSSDPLDRGMAGLVAGTTTGANHLYFIAPDAIQNSTTNIFDHQMLTL